MRQKGQKSTIHDPRYRRMIRTFATMRQQAELSQSDMAKLLGLSQPDISKIERCERRLDLLESLEWLKAANADGPKIISSLWSELRVPTKVARDPR